MARLQKKVGIRKYSASVGLSDEGLGQVNMMCLSSTGIWVSDLFVLSSVSLTFLSKWRKAEWQSLHKTQCI